MGHWQATRSPGMNAQCAELLDTDAVLAAAKEPDPHPVLPKRQHLGDIDLPSAERAHVRDPTAGGEAGNSSRSIRARSTAWRESPISSPAPITASRSAFHASPCLAVRSSSAVRVSTSRNSSSVSRNIHPGQPMVRGRPRTIILSAAPAQKL